MLPNVMAPDAIKIYGSRINSFKEGASHSVRVTDGCNMKSCKSPSPKARADKIKKGADFPTNSYIMPFFKNKENRKIHISDFFKYPVD